MTARIGSVGGAVLGAVAILGGFGISAFIGEPSPSGPPRVDRQPLGIAPLEAEVALLQQRLAAVEAKASYPLPSHPSAAPPLDRDPLVQVEPAPSEPEDVGDSAETVAATNDELFAAEPLDRRRASRLESEISGGLQALTTTEGFEFETVNCRTNRCKATLTFSTPDKALAAAPTIAGADWGAECETSVLTPSSDVDSDGRQRTQVFYNCE